MNMHPIKTKSERLCRLLKHLLTSACYAYRLSCGDRGRGQSIFFPAILRCSLLISLVSCSAEPARLNKRQEKNKEERKLAEKKIEAGKKGKGKLAKLRGDILKATYRRPRR